ncbi:hypothetical protein H7170_02180 [Candidatus Gracilibacteria bacterium]|nr:hypothetical protein [Candidatus Gracilibacteria bacterium]
MQSEFRKSDEEWQDVLKKALEKADKNSPDFQKKLDILLAIFMNDTTSTKVNSVISFMEIVARVPENHVSIPFHK